MKNNLGGFMAAAMLLGVPLLAGCGPAHKSFEHDVRPILQQNCSTCWWRVGLIPPSACRMAVRR
jgi:hypothetical protein